ncbi:glycine cleavage system aminomethyltransferase GcvT [Ruminococcaceae bacterium OttesenSCG-928-A11]|nr:glycine cleavage system aminomethyltransferase GcvT [Ruminococcaceae bacterium OttesenSCG-928-A11]
MELKTPLYDCHLAAGGKMVPFAGYLLPVQYAGVIDEHMAVRQKAGLFDVSHMGEVTLAGPDALANLNNLFTNDFTSLPIGKVRYSTLCNAAGGVVDDVLVYRTGETAYLLVVNAANRHKDVDWMRAHLFGDAKMEDVSDSYAQLALQGPAARAILEKLAAPESIPEKYYSFVENAEVAGVKCLVSQTGYTGEHGYELYCAAADGPKLWDALLAAGKDEGLVPAGLGARDTLRLEAAMPLYGHEMDDTITPLETGLGFCVKMDKPDFIGKAALVEKGAPAITRVGLKMTGRGIAREHCPVYAGEEKIGETTSGTHLPFLNGAYAMALVDKAHSAVGTALEVEVRGRRIAAEVVPLPFYKRG